MISDYNKFLNELLNEAKKNKKTERPSYDYNCVMLFIDMPYWDTYTSKIDSNDISTHEDSDGLLNKSKAHVTILYGIHKDVPLEDVEKIINTIDVSKFNIQLKDVSYFECPNYDVVKISVEDEYLTELNKKFKELPYTSDYPDYKAHITLAYVNKGEAKKYCDGLIDITNGGLEMSEIFKPTKIVYSEDKTKHEYLKDEFSKYNDKQKNNE